MDSIYSIFVPFIIIAIFGIIMASLVFYQDYRKAHPRKP